MVILQNDEDSLPILEGITPEMTLFLGVATTLVISSFCLYLGYRKRTYDY